MFNIKKKLQDDFSILQLSFYICMWICVMDVFILSFLVAQRFVSFRDICKYMETRVDKQVLERDFKDKAVAVGHAYYKFDDELGNILVWNATQTVVLVNGGKNK